MRCAGSSCRTISYNLDDDIKDCFFCLFFFLFPNQIFTELSLNTHEYCTQVKSVELKIIWKTWKISFVWWFPKSSFLGFYLPRVPHIHHYRHQRNEHVKPIPLNWEDFFWNIVLMDFCPMQSFEKRSLYPSNTPQNPKRHKQWGKSWRKKMLLIRI